MKVPNYHLQISHKKIPHTELEGVKDLPAYPPGIQQMVKDVQLLVTVLARGSLGLCCLMSQMSGTMSETNILLKFETLIS